ncbi:hypothetical protein Tco_0806851 [Tanacetum coccineum]
MATEGSDITPPPLTEGGTVPTSGTVAADSAVSTAAHTINIRGDDTDLPLLTEQCPQPKQVTKNDVKSRPEPHLCVFETRQQGWWQMEKIGDLWRVWTDGFGNRLVDVLLLSYSTCFLQSVKDGSVRHFPSLENHFWANHCKEGKGFIPVKPGNGSKEFLVVVAGQ